MYGPLVGNSCGGLRYFHVKEKNGEKEGTGKMREILSYQSVTTLDYDFGGNGGSV